MILHFIMIDITTCSISSLRTAVRVMAVKRIMTSLCGRMSGILIECVRLGNRLFGIQHIQLKVQCLKVQTLILIQFARNIPQSIVIYQPLSTSLSFTHLHVYTMQKKHVWPFCHSIQSGCESCQGIIFASPFVPSRTSTYRACHWSIIGRVRPAPPYIAAYRQALLWTAVIHVNCLCMPNI